MCWVDVQGLGDEGVLRRLAEIFSIHPLALEDAVNAPQRPKTEAYEGQQLILTRMARLLDDGRLDVEQVSLFLGAGWLLTLQERQGDVFDPVRARLRAAKGMIRTSGADYLAYALVDTIVDGFYPVIESLGDQLVDLEDAVLANPTRDALRDIYTIKRELLALRRAAWPQREMLAMLLRDGSPYLSQAVALFLRDTLDHTVQVVDVTESYRELAGNLMDLHLSTTSNRTNDVMKVLTIMASIFIPLTFIAGVYGMNFDAMPELHARWAYPAVLATMVVVAVGMLIYFRRRGWLGDG